MRQISILLFLLVAAIITKAQDVHFAAVQDMNVWYNPALKINRLPEVHVNIQNVKYPGLIGYTNNAGTIELPLVSATKNVSEVSGFANISAGISSASAGTGIMKVSNAMLAFSYALPLNYDNTYIALGFQGAYSFSLASLSGYNVDPAAFDKYGVIGSAIVADPFQSGYQYGYLTVGTGVSIFHDGEQRWYAGASVRNYNQPYTEWSHAVRLSRIVGLQGGYDNSISDDNSIGCFTVLNWNGTVNELFIGGHYNHNLDDSVRNTVSFGLAYRIGDAIIPDMSLKFGSHRVGVYYELNAFRTPAGFYRRRAFEFSYRLIL